MRTKRSNTTFLGAGLAAVLIYVAVTLSQPNAANTSLGRGVTWLLAKLPVEKSRPSPSAPAP